MIFIGVVFPWMEWTQSGRRARTQIQPLSVTSLCCQFLSEEDHRKSLCPCPLGVRTCMRERRRWPTTTEAARHRHNRDVFAPRLIPKGNTLLSSWYSQQLNSRILLRALEGFIETVDCNDACSSNLWIRRDIFFRFFFFYYTPLRLERWCQDHYGIWIWISLSWR